MGWFDGLKEWGHTALDIVGMFPVAGNLADLANAAWYKAEGDNENAALSLLAAAPGAGQIATATKLAAKSGAAAAKATKTAQKTASGAKRQAKAALTAVEGGRASKKAAQEALDLARTRTPGLGSPPKSALVGKAQKELTSKKKLLKEARKKARQDVSGLRGAKQSLKEARAAEAASKTLRGRYGAAKGAFQGKLGTQYIGGKGKTKLANFALAVLGLPPAQRRDAQRKMWAELPQEERDKHDSFADFIDYLDDLAGSAKPKPPEPPTAPPPGEKEGLLDEESERRAKKGARKQRKAARAQREREEQRERRDFKESQRRFDKRMQLKEARLGRKEERKAANQADDRIKLAADMAGKMAEDPDFFKKNREEKYDLFARAKRLGITADQFNSFINRNYENAKREYKLREFDRESAEGRAWLNEKLDQPSLNQMGVPTPSARGRNIARYKTGKVSPTDTEVRESVRESDEDERKRQRSRDRGRRQIEGRRGRGGGKRPLTQKLPEGAWRTPQTGGATGHRYKRGDRLKPGDSTSDIGGTWGMSQPPVYMGDSKTGLRTGRGSNPRRKSRSARR